MMKPAGGERSLYDGPAASQSPPPPPTPRPEEGDRVGLLSSSDDFALLQEQPSPAVIPAVRVGPPSYETATSAAAVPRPAAAVLPGSAPVGGAAAATGLGNTVSSFSLESPEDANWAATRSQSLVGFASSSPIMYSSSAVGSRRRRCSCSPMWWWRALAAFGVLATIAILVALSVPLMKARQVLACL